jgi:hypothetical protein
LLATATTALAVAYVLVPNASHALLPGIPLSLLSAAALVVALARLALPPPCSRMPLAVAAVLVGLVLVKGWVAALLPTRGFQAAYSIRGVGSPDDVVAPDPYHRVDRTLDFDADSFPRLFLNNRRFFRVPGREALPFRAVWRGAIVLPEPTLVRIEAVGSEPVAVTVDGQPPPNGSLLGAHEVTVRFARETAAPPSLRVAIERGERRGKEPIPVFAGPMTVGRARFDRSYAAAAVALDLLVLLVLAHGAVRGLVAVLAAPRALSWLPPFRVWGSAVIAFWFVFGAVRTAPNFRTVELQGQYDDWFDYESAARSILAGDLTGGEGLEGRATFLYPFYLALMHVLFGEFQWPVYFAQYVTLGLACVALGVLGRKLWGEGLAVGVLAAVTLVALLDVSRWYPIRFLGENLALLVLPLAFLGLHAYLERPNVARAARAGALLAAALLTRFSVAPFAVVALGYLVLRRPGANPGAGWIRLSLVGAFLAAYALVLLRNWVADGTLAPIPLSARQQFAGEGKVLGMWRVSWIRPILDVVLPNLLFMAGYPKLVQAAYSVRPHWLLLWGSYLAWAGAGRGRECPPTVALLHGFIVVYAATMAFVKEIGVYGFRHVLLLSFMLSPFLALAPVELTRAIRRRSRRG